MLFISSQESCAIAKMTARIARYISGSNELLRRYGGMADPTTSPCPKMGVLYAPKIREWSYLRNGWSDALHVWF